MRAAVDTAAPARLAEIVRRLAAHEAAASDAAIISPAPHGHPNGTSAAGASVSSTSAAGAAGDGLFLEELLVAVITAAGADGGVVMHLGIEAGTEAAGSAPHAALRILAVHPQVTTPEGHATIPPWLRRIAPAIPATTAEGRAVVLPVRDPAALYGQNTAGHAVAMPVPGEAGLGLFAVLFVASSNRADAEPCRHQLELCSGVLAWFFAQQSSRGQRHRARLLAIALGVLSRVGEQPRFRSAAMALCQEVATRWRASRVTLGICSGRYIKARAMSRTEQLDRKTKLVQAIEAAMEECADQDLEVLYPTEDTATTVYRAARELSLDFGRHHVLSMPLRLRAPQGSPHGKLPDAVLTIEVPATEDGELAATIITAEAIEALRLTCNLLAPLLLKLYEADRWLGAKLAREARHAAAWAVGSKHTWAKVAAMAGCGLLLLATLYPAPHRVTAPFLLQPHERQLIVAPFDGYLQAVHVAPGDRVMATATPRSSGASHTEASDAGHPILAELDTIERKLQLAERQADRAQFLKQADVARREGKTADMQIAQAEAERVAAEIALLELQIQRATLRSPLAGVVLEGDHRRRVGGAVSKGEVLFEIGPPPPEGLRAELRVPEGRLVDLRVGQLGQIAAASQPGVYLPVTLEKIEPKAEVLDGQNVFRVWVTLGENPLWLRPGMEGVAKIEIGTTNYLWIWTHDAVNWVRMKLWM